jgi:hypothetical protein
MMMMVIKLRQDPTQPVSFYQTKQLTLLCRSGLLLSYLNG